MKIGLISEFDAAHHLPCYEGRCASVHGHTYRAEVVLEGPVGPDGFVMDFYKLKKILSSVLEELDHSDLNEILENPTAERIAERIAEQISRRLRDEPEEVGLVSIKLWEGRNKWVMLD